MEIKTKYDPEQMVYLVHDPDQYQRMIVDIIVNKKSKRYLLRCGSEESEHYESELSTERNKSLAMNLNNDED